ncbi:MAG: hypothetical protein LBG07_10815 [Treponema sp.]|jgi:hypothetical protein|nr:hypothetical protein [Treponema sp.]
MDRPLSKKLLFFIMGFFFALSGFSPPLSLGAMDWPSSGGLVTANFGLNEQGRPCLGTVFRSTGPIRSADKGELVFYRTQEDKASRLPSPLGSWIAYDHGDGILGIYSRFAEEKNPAGEYSPADVSPAGNSPGEREQSGPVSPAGPVSSTGPTSSAGPENTENSENAGDAANAVNMVSLRLREPPVQTRQGEIIAASGISGCSAQRGFYFALYDRRERRWVNPSLIIVPFPDDRPPEILSVQLRDSEGRLIPPAQGRIGQGRYSIIVNVADALSRSSPIRLAPHRLGVFLNGAEAGSLNFETFSARDGVLSVRRNGLAPVSEVYAPYPALKMGEAWFTRGQTSLEVIARDIMGNEASLIRRLEVE